MAQTKTIQLLRSSQAYASIEAAKTAIQGLVGERKDGEILLGRYWSGTGNNAVIKSVLAVYHAAPDLTGDNITNGTTKGWTFIQDITSSSEGLQALQDEVDLIETALGFNTDGTKSNFTDTDALQIIAANDTIVAAVEKVAKALGALDKTASAVNGQVVTTVTQTNGLVSETKANVKDLQLGGYSKDTSATGAIGSTDTVNTALSKLENKIDKNTVSSNDKTVTIDTTGTTTNLSVNIDGHTLVKDTTDGTISSALKVIKVIPTGTAGTDEVVDSTLGTNVKEAYRLVYDGSTSAIGQQINVYKDSALSRVYLGHVDDTIDTTDGDAATTGHGDTALCFVYHKEDGSYELVPVNVQSFLQESEFADGLQVANHVVSVKIDSTSEKDGQSTPASFLTVSSNGIKIDGIKNEIARQINALDVTTDAAVAGQYVAAIEETDGIVAVKTRANVADAVLTGYSKGSTAPASTAVAATDDVKGAIAKLEWQIDETTTAAVEDLDATVTSTDGTNVQVKVTEVDGVITAVNVTTDNTINETYLNDKIATLDGSAIATAASGNVYSVLTGVTETDGVISKTGEVTLAAVAKTGAAADVSIADAGSLITATNVENALQEIAGNLNAAKVVANDVITVDTTNNTTKLTVTTGNGLEKTNSTLSVKDGDGITVDANGVSVNAGNGLQISSDAVTVKIDTTSTGHSDMLTVGSNGILLSDTWDCGTF